MNNKFQTFTTNVVTILGYTTQLLVGYSFYKLTGSIFTGILSFIMLEVCYAGYVLSKAGGIFAFSEEKANEIILELQPYWLAINSAICILLSRLY